MSESGQNDHPDGTLNREHPDPAEAKRLAARRRFVKQGAAGSGGAVLTFYHTKGYARGKKLVLSSQLACLSITGTPGKTVKVQDSVVPYVYDAKGKKHKNIVEKQECELIK